MVNNKPAEKEITAMRLLSDGTYQYSIIKNSDQNTDLSDFKTKFGYEQEIFPSKKLLLESL